MTSNIQHSKVHWMRSWIACCMILSILARRGWSRNRIVLPRKKHRVGIGCGGGSPINSQKIHLLLNTISPRSTNFSKNLGSPPRAQPRIFKNMGHPQRAQPRHFKNLGPHPTHQSRNFDNLSPHQIAQPKQFGPFPKPPKIFQTLGHPQRSQPRHFKNLGPHPTHQSRNFETLSPHQIAQTKQFGPFPKQPKIFQTLGPAKSTAKTFQKFGPSPNTPVKEFWQPESPPNWPTSRGKNGPTSFDSSYPSFSEILCFFWCSFLLFF